MKNLVQALPCLHPLFNRSRSCWVCVSCSGTMMMFFIATLLLSLWPNYDSADVSRITLHPCWLHVCQGTKLKYTCQHIDTGSGVGRWPSTDLCHRPRAGEYCGSIGMPPPFRSGYYRRRQIQLFIPFRFCALFVPCPQAEDSLHEY